MLNIKSVGFCLHKPHFINSEGLSPLIVLSCEIRSRDDLRPLGVFNQVFCEQGMNKRLPVCAHMHLGDLRIH